MVRRVAFALLCLWLQVQPGVRVMADDFADEWRPPSMEVLSTRKWEEVDSSVARALAWLASQQQADGSFPSKSSGQPAVTSLCVIAFLSSGHTPGRGPYGDRLNLAVDFVLRGQRNDVLFTLDGTQLPADVWNEETHTATYNQAIAGLMLGEVYGQTNGRASSDIKQAIDRGLIDTRELQRLLKYGEID